MVFKSKHTHGLLTALHLIQATQLVVIVWNPMILCGFEDGSLSAIDMRTTNTISTIYNHSEPIFSIDTFVKKFSMVFGGASKSLNLHSFNGSLITEQFLA